MAGEESKLQINPALRLRAMSREQMLAIADLFARRRRIINTHTQRNILDWATKSRYGNLKNVKIPAYDERGKRSVIGLATMQGMIVDRSVSSKLKDRKRMRAIVGHESAHMLGLVYPEFAGNNHLVTANAISTYISLYGEHFAKPRKPVTLADTIYIELMFLKDTMRKAVKRAGSLRDAEYASYEGASMEKAGINLAKLAFEAEEKLKLPGVGFFIIRDISQGVRVFEALKKAQKGEYNRQLVVWMNRHPSIRNFIMHQSYYLDYLTLLKSLKSRFKGKKRVRPRKKKKAVILHKP